MDGDLPAAGGPKPLVLHGCRIHPGSSHAVPTLRNAVIDDGQPWNSNSMDVPFPWTVVCATIPSKRVLGNPDPCFTKPLNRGFEFCEACSAWRDLKLSVKHDGVLHPDNAHFLERLDLGRSSAFPC